MIFGNWYDFRLCFSIIHLQTTLLAQVRVQVLRNSSVRETVILVGGEQHDGWQWIGGSVLLSPQQVGGGNAASPSVKRTMIQQSVADSPSLKSI